MCRPASDNHTVHRVGPTATLHAERDAVIACLGDPDAGGAWAVQNDAGAAVELREYRAGVYVASVAGRQDDASDALLARVAEACGGRLESPPAW